MAEFFDEGQSVAMQLRRIRAALAAPLDPVVQQRISKNGFCSFQLVNRMGCRFGFDPNDLRQNKRFGSTLKFSC